MKKFKRTRYLLGFVILLAIVESAVAELVTHNFTGTVTFVSGTPFGLSIINPAIQYSALYAA